jgi:hypothetical protein
VVEQKGGSLHFFGGRLQLRDFMRKPEYWRGSQTPFVITLVRRPITQIASTIRYLWGCCEVTKKEWCTSQKCDTLVGGLEAYMGRQCGFESCNRQAKVR